MTDTHDAEIEEVVENLHLELCAAENEADKDILRKALKALADSREARGVQRATDFPIQVADENGEIKPLTVIIAEAEARGRESMREEAAKLKINKPKGPCINAENHLFGSCFACKEIDGYNKAIDDIRSLPPKPITRSDKED